MAAKEGVDRVWEAIETIKFCMLASQGGRGLRSRPMAAIVRREENCIWFLTDIRAHKDEEVRAHPQVCAAFADTAHNTYVSVSGTAVMNRDIAKVKELWGPWAQAWFPDGPDSPNVALLRLSPEEAEIWDGTSSRIVYAVQAMKAMVTGDRPNVGEHQKVAM